MKRNAKSDTESNTAMMKHYVLQRWLLLQYATVKGRARIAKGYFCKFNNTWFSFKWLKVIKDLYVRSTQTLQKLLPQQMSLCIS